MFKHIVGQTIFQLTVICVLVFVGEQFIPEYVDSYDSGVFANNPEYKWYNGLIGGTVRSGRFTTITGSPDYQSIYEEFGINSRHFTFIFNTFVMMQVFNFLNARKLHEEFNIFEGLSRNPMFIVIVIGIIALQIILITFTGNAFSVYNNFGLAPQQWLLSAGIGAIGLVVNFILKALPIAKHDHVHEDHGFGNK